MTDWPTADQVIADWAEGHGAPAERMSMHPSMPIWAATPDAEGRWTVTRDGRTVWAGMTGSVEDIVALLEQMRRQDLPPGAWRETAGVERRPVEEAGAAPPVDPLFWRGLAWACVLSAPAWLLAAWLIWRVAS